MGLRLRQIVRESLGELLEITAGFFEHDGILIGVHADAVRSEWIGRNRAHGQTADDSRLLVIEQREHLGMILGNQKGSTPELRFPVFKPVDELGHVRQSQSTVAA